MIAVLVTVVAWASYPAVMVAVPLLILAEIALPDEKVRLLAFGLILAAGWSGAAVERRPPPAAAGRSGHRFPILALGAIVLLRWIPFHFQWRELFLLAAGALIVFVLGRTPFAMTVAVVTILITPAVPLRTLALPLFVLIVAVLARFYGMPRLRWTLPSLVVLAFVMTFFAWSGIAARAFPYFLRQAQPDPERYTVNYALKPGEVVTVGVPDGARALIVSGANVARFRRGTLLGSIEPGGREVRIGDAADWGYLRREFFYGSHNPLPRDAVGKVRGYGYEAWIDGAGRVPLPPGARTIRVAAAPALPSDAAFQVEAFEIAKR
jgi:hypothetical protein